MSGKKMKELLEAELLYMRKKNGNSLNNCLFSMHTCTLKKVHAIQGSVINADSIVVPGTVLQVCQLMGLRLGFVFASTDCNFMDMRMY